MAKLDEKRVQEAVASMLKDRNQRDALAEIIVDFVQPNHLTNEFMSQILGTRRLNPGDSLVKKVRKGIEVRTLVPGSVHLASEITVTERMNYVLDGADVKVTYNLWELESGEIGTVQEIRREMAAKLREYFVNKVFTALSTVWTAVNTPNNYISVGGSLTAAALEDGINYMNNNVTSVKAILGTRAAVTPITKFGAFWTDGSNTEGSQTAIDEIRDRGWLGKYYGVPVLALDQIYDNPDDYNALLPTDFVLLVGENVGEFITYGDVKSKQWEDMNPTPPQWMLEIYQQFGLMIDNAQGIYVIGNLS
jgi:hypothetical protein